LNTKQKEQGAEPKLRQLMVHLKKIAQRLVARSRGSIGDGEQAAPIWVVHVRLVPCEDQAPKENSMKNVTGALALPGALFTDKARGAVTGHNVRYVLGFGLAGIVLAFIIVALSFGLGAN
jgi:hypothetical protein